VLQHRGTVQAEALAGVGDLVLPARVDGRSSAWHLYVVRTGRREELLARVWGYDFATDTNVVEVYVLYLRRKLEAGGEPRLLHTVRGAGYVLRDG
jgi:hypothetical protein